MENREKESKKIVIYSILQNTFLAILKISGGIFGNSRALLSDGFNSLSDIGSSIAIYLGICFSNKPADKEHPFGHEKIESIIGVIVGVFLILTSFELGKGSVEILYHNSNTKIPSFFTIIIAVISVIVKYCMYKSKMKVGLATSNSALIADAKDSKSDVISSIGVILGIFLSIYISPIFDTIVSLIVAILIFKEGISIILETTDIILDRQDEELINRIKEYAVKKNITGVHDIYMRTSGSKIYITMHIRVPQEMTVFDAHNLAHELKIGIKKDFEHIEDVMIHVDYLI